MQNAHNPISKTSVFCKHTILTGSAFDAKMRLLRQDRYAEANLRKDTLNDMAKRAVYKKDIPKRMYNFFTSRDEATPPSFSKFAKSIGVTLADLEAWRSKREFDKAYCECNEIRRDYLIDAALTKRYDSSFVKFLLSEEASGSDAALNTVNVNLRVLADGENGA